MSTLSLCIDEILETYSTGHIHCLYTPKEGALEGQQRRGFVSPKGKAVKSIPASASPVKPKAPAKEVVVVEQSASPAPRKPKAASKQMPTVEDGEHNYSFYARCVAVGFTRKEAAASYRKQRDAKRDAPKEPRFPKNPMPRAKHDDAVVPTTASGSDDVDAITDNRRARKLAERSLHTEGNSLRDDVAANSAILAAIAKRLGLN